MAATTPPARITIYKNDGRWDRSHARLCLIHPSTTMRDIREQLSSEKKAIDDEDGVTLILRGGTPVPDLRLLRDGDEVSFAGPPRPSAVSSPSSIPSSSSTSSTSASSPPREVTVSFFVNNIKKIDVIEGTVEIDFQLYLSWVDPALAGIAVADRPPYEPGDRDRNDETPCCWNPQIEVNNNVSLKTLWAVYPPPYQGEDDGRVVWGARFRGSIGNEMDLRNFPIDSDSVHITVGPKNATMDKVMLVVDPKKHRRSPFDDDVDRPGDRIKSVSLTEWQCDVPCVRRGLSGPTGSGSYYVNVEFIVIVHRNFMFYVWKVLIILVILILFSWMVLWQDPEDFSSRFGQSLTLLLAAVAFLFVVNNSLPKISYLTILDKVMLLCFAAIFFVGLESFAVYLLSKYGGDKNADEDDVDGGGRSIDMHMRYVYPLVFVACQARVAWGAVATRARLIGDPAAQWALVTDSGDSKLKPMPGEDNDRGGGDAGSGEGNMDKEDEVKGAEKRDDDGAAASAGGEDQKKRAEEESKKKALLLGGTLAITSTATKAPASAASSSSSSGGAQARRTSHLTHVLTGSTEAAQRQKLNRQRREQEEDRTDDDNAGSKKTAPGVQI